MFIDSHCHLDGPRFDADREQVITRAHEGGITHMLAIGTGDGPGTLDCAVKLAAQYEYVYASVGIHPHEAQQAKESDFSHLHALAKDSKVIAWGEIGLDYYYDHSPREIQKTVFVRQMELARAAKLPIVIHCRASDKVNDTGGDAWEDCLSLIEQHWRTSGLGGILHCFTSTWSHAQRALDMGFMISFAGNVTFPKAQQIRESASRAPLDRMLIETDSPFLAPVPYRGKRSEPLFVKEVARQIGELRRISTEEVGAHTSANFFRFFPGAGPKKRTDC
jgi:TatD DNase family protein